MRARWSSMPRIASDGPLLRKTSKRRGNAKRCFRWAWMRSKATTCAARWRNRISTAGSSTSGGNEMGLLHRQRLIERLSDTANGVTLIAARPGYGKSVAVRQLRDSLNAPMLHYEVRTGGFVPFVRGFVESAA